MGKACWLVVDITAKSWGWDLVEMLGQLQMSVPVIIFYWNALFPKTNALPRLIVSFLFFF